MPVCEARQFLLRCRHIKDVHKVKLVAPALESKGKKACVVIITDGEASDGDLLEAMKPLDDLPVLILHGWAESRRLMVLLS